MRYELLVPMTVNGKRHGVGEIVELQGGAVETFIARGYVKPVPPEPPKVEPPKPEASKPRRKTEDA